MTVALYQETLSDVRRAIKQLWDMRISRIKSVADHKCPSCGAGCGEDCRTSSGKVVVIHATRRKLNRDSWEVSEECALFHSLLIREAGLVDALADAVIRGGF